MLTQWRALVLTLTGIVLTVAGVILSSELMSFGILVTIPSFGWLVIAWLDTPVPERELP